MNKPQPIIKNAESAGRAALRVVGPYILFAAAWILLSDWVLLSVSADIASYGFYSVIKGAVFILVSAVMLFFLLRNELIIRWRVEHDREDLLAREQAARGRAESASRAKDELLAMVSHELRTPLTAILTSAEVLEQDPTLSGENREVAQMIRESVLHESRIVGDLLDCTSLASGKLELRLDRADMHCIIESVAKDLEGEIGGKGLILTLKLSADAHVIRGDRRRMAEALRNLLANSIKFTPEGGTISVRTSFKAPYIIVEVADSGRGMLPEVQDRLFKPFEQGDRSITREFGGLGLGLYLAKSIVELHGGTINGSSAGAEKGSTFHIELPAWVSAEAEAPTPQEKPSDCEGMVVLLVEDNIDTLRALGRLLGRLGCVVMAARTGAEALEIAAREKVDLIVSDIGLPDSTGWDVMKQLRLKSDISGIAISGFNSEDDRLRSEKAGFMVHLVKPISFPALQAAVLDFSAGLRKRRAAGGAEAAGAAVEVSSKK